MKDENEIRIAWKLQRLILEFNLLLLDRYKEEFLRLYLKNQQKLFRGSLMDYMNIDDT